MQDCYFEITKMYLLVSVLAAVVAQKALGSPIYFPDEVQIDNDGRGVRLLPGIYLHPAPKSLESKPVSAVMDIEVTGTDDNHSSMNINSTMLERVGNNEEPMPIMELFSEHVQHGRNISSKDGSDITENTNSNIESLVDSVDSKVFKNGANVKVTDEIDTELHAIDMEIVTEADYVYTGEIGVEISENTQSNDTSLLSLVNDVQPEMLMKGNDGINSENIVMDIVTGTEADYLDIEMATEAEFINIDIQTENEPVVKLMKFELDLSSPMNSRVGADIIVFGEEMRRPVDNIFLFPTPRSPVQSNSALGSRNIPDSPVFSSCYIEGEILYQGECYQALTSWPCGSEDKWLVMKSFDISECEPRPCPLGQIFYQDTCVRPDDSNICARGQMLYVEITGNSYCDCDPDYIYYPQDGTCIPEYEQGWCPWGEYLVRNKNGIPECTSNPCKMSGSVFHEESKMCYKKNYVGFCKQEDIEIKGNIAECIEIEFIHALRNVFEVPTLRRCPKGSLRDVLHECRRRFNMPSIPSVLKARHLYGGCPNGWRKAHGRKCKKIANLFSSPK